MVLLESQIKLKKGDIAPEFELLGMTIKNIHSKIMKIIKES